jgi:hypothetical protein
MGDEALSVEALCAQERALGLSSTRGCGEYPFALEDSYERNRARYMGLSLELCYDVGGCSAYELSELEALEESALVASAGLTRRQLVCVVLYYLRGYDMVEIGRLLGISKQAVRKSLLAGVSKLRASYESCALSGLSEVYAALCGRGAVR